jgi:hypothetical protein
MSTQKQTSESPEWLFYVSSESDVRSLSITKYKIARETDKRWVVKVRGSEKSFAKRLLRLFTSEEALRQWLQKQKKKQLETAQRAVRDLSGEVAIHMHEVPEERYSEPQKGLTI